MARAERLLALPQFGALIALAVTSKDRSPVAPAVPTMSEIVGSSPEAFAGFITQDIAIWKEVADRAKIEVR